MTFLFNSCMRSKQKPEQTSQTALQMIAKTSAAENPDLLAYECRDSEKMRSTIEMLHTAFREFYRLYVQPDQYSDTSDLPKLVEPEAFFAKLFVYAAHLKQKNNFQQLEDIIDKLQNYQLPAVPEEYALSKFTVCEVLAFAETIRASLQQQKTTDEQQRVALVEQLASLADKKDGEFLDKEEQSLLAQLICQTMQCHLPTKTLAWYFHTMAHSMQAELKPEIFASLQAVAQQLPDEVSKYPFLSYGSHSKRKILEHLRQCIASFTPQTSPQEIEKKLRWLVQIALVVRGLKPFQAPQGRTHSGNALLAMLNQDENSYLKTIITADIGKKTPEADLYYSDLAYFARHLKVEKQPRSSDFRAEFSAPEYKKSAYSLAAR